MAAPQLTVKQFAQITLGQIEPPWHLGSLLPAYGQKFLDLRQTLANLSAAQTVLYVAVRSAQAVSACVSSISSDPGSNRSQEIWTDLWTAQNAVSSSDFEALQQVLIPVGASIVYLNPTLPPTGQFAGTVAYVPAWSTVGFAGTFVGLASLNAEILPFAPTAWSDIELASLKALQSGVVIVPAGAAYTSALLIAGSLAPGFTPGPPIKNMMILGGGSSAG